MAVIAAGGMLCSCSDDNPWGQQEGEGRVSLTLTSSTEVKSAIPQITRATAPDVPDESEFAITMARIDGSWSKDYASLAEFNSAATFKTGAYTLTATYGSLNDEGFEKPCYRGETQLTVLEERTTEATVTATLASAMVSISYTDAFKEYFRNWGAQVHTDGHSYIDYESGETRPAYIAPGNTAIAIEVTDHSNRTVKLSPCSFESVERHHYNVTFDVNGSNVGVAQLTVTFDDSLTREDVIIDLSDELYTIAPPTIFPQGFSIGEEIEIIKGETTPGRIAMTVNAPGKLTSAILTFESDTFTPPFGRETELCNAPQTTRTALGSMGIDAKGFFTNPDEIAWLDITGLVAHLPEGRHKLTLLAKDKTDRASQPVSITFDIVPIEIAAAAASSAYGAESALVDVSYNGTNPREDISFLVMNDLGQYQEAEIISMTETATRSITAKTYSFEIGLPDTERANIPAKMLLKGEEAGQFTIALTFPKYTLQADAFARYALLKVIPEKAGDLNTIVSKIKITLQGANASQTTMTRDAEAGTITLSGLTPGSSYTAQTSLTTDGEKTSISFTTEAETQLPNSDFSQSTTTVNIDPITVGGPYTGTALNNPKYQTTSSIVRQTPNGWATLNELTCWSNSSNLNSWFVVPSTYTENEQAVIRTVGYSHAGTTPGVTKETAVYYCKNTPAESDLTIASGELFLGSYRYNGSATRSDGTGWSTRPSAFRFDYRYEPYNNETAEAYIRIFDAAGAIMTQQVIPLTSSASMTTKEVVLTGYPFGSKAAKIEVSFKSTKGTPKVKIPTGSALSEGTGLGNKKIGANSYHAVATGSVLTVDNLNLVYDAPGTNRAAKKKTNSRKRK